MNPTPVRRPRGEPDSPVREATSADGPALIELTRACPMEGDIGMCVERGPDFFRLCALGNDGFQVGVTDGPEGSPIGCATVAERRVWLDGRPASVAWASDLKVHAGHRGSGVASDLIRWVTERSRRLVGNDGPILCTVLSGNRAMERRFPGGPGLPVLQPFATLRAHAVPVYQRPLARGGFTVDLARPADRLEMQALWARHAPARQLAPESPVGLRPLPHGGDSRFGVPCHLVARDGAGRIQAFLAVWDERAVKQLRVTGYSVRLGAARTAINLLAPFIGAERLPGTGEVLHSGTVLDLCVPPDAPHLLRALLLAANRAVLGSGMSFLTVGLDARDPLAEALRGMHAQPTDFSCCVTAPAGRYAGPPIGERLVHFEPALG